jgi:hypothetical protein
MTGHTDGGRARIAWIEDSGRSLGTSTKALGIYVFACLVLAQAEPVTGADDNNRDLTNGPG